MGGPRNQRTAGGGVLQPQGVIHAGGAAPGALPAPFNWPPPWRGFFYGCSGASMVFVFLWRPRTKDQRKHG
jgi:hypothetical protein